MKHNILLIGATIVASVVAASCSKPEASDPDQSLEFSCLRGHKVYILEDTAREFGRDADVAFRDSASVILPDVLMGYDVKPLRDSILKMSFDTVCAPEKAMEAYFAATVESFGYSAIPADSTDVENEIDGFCYVQGVIYNLTSERLTYRVSHYTYYPQQAHGLYSNTFITYDLTRGDILTLDDIFTPAGLESLPTVISRRALRLEAQIGPTNITSLPSADNFYISLDDEIVFVYQPYEVASFAQGMIYVPFYPYDLAEFMTPRGLAFFDLDK